MKTNKIIIVGSILMFLVARDLFSQSNESKETGKAQVTFAYPVGSRGAQSGNFTNNFSFNVLYGFNGGVNGFELGSLWNNNKGPVKGLQLSGLMNTTKGNSTGIIMAGIANTNTNSVSGAAVAGILNYGHRSLYGIQLAGVVNIGKDSLTGVAVSGVLNFTKGFAKGIDISTVNFADQMEGLQIGVMNFAGRLKGVQVGVINITNEAANAFPIGLLSIVKNGHYELELAGGEAIYSNLNYKMGTNRIYTVFKMGYSSYLSKPVYSFGVGFGTNISVSEKNLLSVELSNNQISYDNNWNIDKNILNKLDVNYKFFMLNRLSLVLGPSFNIYVTRTKVDGRYGVINIPYTIFSHEYTNSKLYSWIGFNAGVAIRL